MYCCDLSSTAIDLVKVNSQIHMYLNKNDLSCILSAPSVHFLNATLVYFFLHRNILITIPIDVMPLFAM